MNRKAKKAQKHIIERKPDIMAKHIHLYGPSLSNYVDRYANLFFTAKDESEIPAHPAYLCPLCLEKGIAIFKEGFVDNGADFTLDHFPPKNVGGTQTILVSRDCNSKAGLFENELKKKLQDQSFDKGVPNAQRNIRSTISSVQGSYPGLLTMGEDDKISISFKENDNIHSPLLDQWLMMPEHGPDWKADIKYFVADHNKVAKSILKTAYLYCFQYWGYAFCYSRAAELIREVLTDKINFPLQNHGFWLTEKIRNISFPLGLCTLVLPRDIRTFCVNVKLEDLRTKHQEIFCIIVPGPLQQNWDELTQIDQLISDDPNFSISVAHVENTGVTEGECDGYSAAWKLFTGLA